MGVKCRSLLLLYILAKIQPCPRPTDVMALLSDSENFCANFDVGFVARVVFLYVADSGSYQISSFKFSIFWKCGSRETHVRLYGGAIAAIQISFSGRGFPFF
jgi:hypothetical protein